MNSLFATDTLQQMIHNRIKSHGSIPFNEFMHTVLYEPQLGYYTQGASRVGKKGDFFTSVSVGSLFGTILAQRIISFWNETQPSAWRILELGAHDGQLALDILNTIASVEPSAYETLTYVISEPLTPLREAQVAKLSTTHPERVQWIQDFSELSPAISFIFGNELLDALPCHLLEIRDNTWLERRVSIGHDESLEWKLSTDFSEPKLHQALQSLGNQFPEGYQTEIRTNYDELFQQLQPTLTESLMIWIDYGFARPEYYHPDRSTGTVRTFHQHQAGENPLVKLGEIDITAHVDFTSVAEAAITCSLHPIQFQSQGTWLTHLASAWLIQAEKNGTLTPEHIQQFKMLTHPSQLGSQFHVIELSSNSKHAHLNAQLRHKLALPEEIY